LSSIYFTDKDIFLYRKVEFANNLGKKAGALKTGIVTCFMQGKQHDSQLLYALSSYCIINLASEFVKGIMSWKKLQVKKYFVSQ